MSSPNANTDPVSKWLAANLAAAVNERIAARTLSDCADAPPPAPADGANVVTARTPGGVLIERAADRGGERQEGEAEAAPAAAAAAADDGTMVIAAEGNGGSVRGGTTGAGDDGAIAGVPRTERERRILGRAQKKEREEEARRRLLAAEADAADAGVDGAIVNAGGNGGGGRGGVTANANATSGTPPPLPSAAAGGAAGGGGGGTSDRANVAGLGRGIQALKDLFAHYPTETPEQQAVAAASLANVPTETLVQLQGLQGLQDLELLIAPTDTNAGFAALVAAEMNRRTDVPALDDGTIVAIGQDMAHLKRDIADLPIGTLEYIRANIDTVVDAEAAKYTAALITLEIEGRLAQLRSIGKDAAAAGVARILVKWEERQREEEAAALEAAASNGGGGRGGLVDGASQPGDAEAALLIAKMDSLRREVTDLRQRVATLGRLLGVHGTDEDGSDDDLIDEDVDGVLV